MPRPPRHGGEPSARVLGQERRFEQGVGFGLGRQFGLFQGPGRLFQLKSAALPDTGLIGVGEAAAVDQHAGQPRRVETGGGDLGMGGVGEPHGADAAIAPGLRHDPGQGVIAVLALGQVFLKTPLGTPAPAAILINHDVAMGDEMGRHLGARARAGVGGGAFARAWFGFAIRCAFQNHRERPRRGGRSVDVTGQSDTVAHPHHDITVDNHIIAVTGAGNGHGQAPQWSRTRV